MLEMYVYGLSTRKVSKVAEELCIATVSEFFVSTLAAELDSMVTTFLNRSLEIKYLFILSDVLFIKVREDRRVLSNVFHLIFDVNDLGERELLSFSVSDTESYEAWRRLYKNLIERALTGLKLVISNDIKARCHR